MVPVSAFDEVKAILGRALSAEERAALGEEHQELGDLREHPMPSRGTKTHLVITVVLIFLFG
jgi:hypothetical protein